MVPSARVVLATTERSEDDVLEKWSKGRGVDVFRGSENDVLGRISSAVDRFNLENIIEILGDNPLLPKELISQAVELYNNIEHDEKYVATATSEYDFLKGKNLFPIGIRVQIFSQKFIAKLERCASSSEEREHATSYIYSRPSFSNIDFVFPQFPLSKGLSSHNFAINTQEQFDDANTYMRGME